MSSFDQDNMGMTNGNRSGGDEPQSLSLMGGVAQSEGLNDNEILGLDSGGRDRSKRLTQGILLILLVAMIAAGSLFAMRVSQDEMSDNRDVQVDAQIDQWIAKLAHADGDGEQTKEDLDELFGDTKSLVSMFSQDMTTKQIPIEYIKKNPFMMSIAKTVQAEMPVSQGPNRSDVIRKLQSELDRMELQSIVSGSVPLAVIDGEFVRKGDRIGSFVVQSIGTLSVKMTASGEIFELKLEQPGENGRRW